MSMQNQIKQTVPSCAIDVEKVTDPEFLSLLQHEVDVIADSMSLEIILLLVDKWESEYQQKLINGNLSIADALNHYIKLKVSLHHVKRRWEREFDNYDCDFSNSTEEQLVHSRLNKLFILTKEARKNYYVTKRRYEGEHRIECTCRGCRCLKGF